MSGAFFSVDLERVAGDLAIVALVCKERGMHSVGDGLARDALVVREQDQLLAGIAQDNEALHRRITVLEAEVAALRAGVPAHQPLTERIAARRKGAHL